MSENDPLDFGATIAALEKKNEQRTKHIANMKTWNAWANVLRRYTPGEHFKVVIGGQDMWFNDPKGKMRDMMLEVIGDGITLTYAKLEEIDKEPVK